MPRLGARPDRRDGRDRLSRHRRPRPIVRCAGLPAVQIVSLQSCRAFVIRRVASYICGVFLGSSVVEQPAVNRLVAGSNPARGAKTQRSARSAPFSAAIASARFAVFRNQIKGLTESCSKPSALPGRVREQRFQQIAFLLDRLAIEERLRFLRHRQQTNALIEILRVSRLGSSDVPEGNRLAGGAQCANGSNKCSRLSTDVSHGSRAFTATGNACITFRKRLVMSSAMRTAQSSYCG